MKILITGGASGIGFHTGILLARRGHFVYLTTHLESQLVSLEEKIRLLGLESFIQCFCLDITKETDRKKLFQLDIDCLVNNAAIGIGGSILDLPISKIKENFDVNVFSTLEMIQTYAASLFLQNKKGRCIVISSLAGIVPLPFMSSYCATKASLLTFVTALRRELSFMDSNLEVCLVEPGIYRTGFNKVMIDNKDCVQDASYFASIYPSVTKLQNQLFELCGKKDLDSISDQIMKAITSKHPHFLYRAPFLQVVGAKIYALLFQ